MIMLWKCCCLLAAAGLVTSQISEVRRIIRAETERNYVRQARFAKPSGIFGFFTTLGNIKRLFDDQYNETTNALQRVLDLVKDGFSDTATKKPKPAVEETTLKPNETTSTTTERYRISRKEIGYILGRNYRGLQKLLRIELNDAANYGMYTNFQQNRMINNYALYGRLPMFAPIANSTQSDAAIRSTAGTPHYTYGLDTHPQQYRMVTGNGGILTQIPVQDFCTEATPNRGNIVATEATNRNVRTEAPYGELAMFAPIANSTQSDAAIRSTAGTPHYTYGLDTHPQQNRMVTGNGGILTQIPVQGFCTEATPNRGNIVATEATNRNVRTEAPYGELAMFAPIANSTQSDAAIRSTAGTPHYTYGLDTHPQQNRMVTGNGGILTQIPVQGFCTEATPNRGNIVATEATNRNVRTEAPYGELAMFAPIANSTQSDAAIRSTAGTPHYTYGLDTHPQQNRMVTGNGGILTQIPVQGFCTEATPNRGNIVATEATNRNVRTEAPYGELAMFAPIANSTQSDAAIRSTAGTPHYTYGLDTHPQQNRMVTGNGGILTQIPVQGFCTEATPNRGNIVATEATNRNVRTEAPYGELAMFAPIANSTQSDAAIRSTAGTPHYTYDLDTHPQQNRMVTGNGGILTQIPVQGFCTEATPNRGNIVATEATNRNVRTEAPYGELAMFAPIANSTQSDAAIRSTAGTPHYTYGLDTHTQQNRILNGKVDTATNSALTTCYPTAISTQSSALNTVEGLHTEAQENELPTVNSTQSMLRIGDVVNMETWEDVCNLYVELVENPIGVNGALEVEICSAVQDSCTDIDQNGSAKVVQNLIDENEPIDLLTHDLDEDCYIGMDDDIIDIECSDDVGGDLDAILGSISSVGYETSASSSAYIVESRQADAPTIPVFEPALAEQDMDAFKKNRSLSAASRKRPVETPKMRVQTSDQGGKTLACPFCQERHLQLARHMRGVHKTEKEIVKLLSLSKEQHAESRYILNILKNRGQYLWNSNPENDEYIPLRRPQPGHEKDADNFKYCPKCLGSYVASNIRHHYPKCFKGKLNGEHIALILSKAIGGQIDAGASDRLRLQIFPVLRVDNVVKLIRYDSLLIVYGNKLCIKYTPHYQENMIRARLRLVGRLLFTIKTINSDVSDLASVYQPKLYDSLVESIRVVGGYNPLTNEFKSPATAASAVTQVKQIGKILVAECIKREDPVKQQRTENFLKLLESDIGTSILKCVADTQARMRREKKINIPTTDDVKRLYQYLNAERKKSFTQLKNAYSYFNWLRLAEYTMASIIVFNRRRVGEIQNIVVTDFELRETLSKTKTPEFAALSEEEKKVASAYTRLHIRGKKGRLVPVLLTADLVECVDLLIFYRTTAGVPECNQFVFGLPSFYDERIKVIDACMLMRKFSVLCGASDPESLRATEMRKHMASACISMNLNDSLVSQVADFMGHDEKIHFNYYRINKIGRQVVTVSQILTEALGGDDDDDADDDDNDQQGESQSGSRLDVDQESDNDHHLNDSNSLDGVGYNERSSLSPIFSNTDTATESQRTQTHKTSTNRGRSSDKQQIVQNVHSHSVEESDEWTPNGLSKVKFPKRRWTEDEVKAVHSSFASYFQSQTLPSTEEIKKQQQNHQHLRSRTWQQIKTWIHNQFKAGPQAKKRKFK